MCNVRSYTIEIQKCDQFLCPHKACFLMPGHIILYERTLGLSLHIRTITCTDLYS